MQPHGSDNKHIINGEDDIIVVNLVSNPISALATKPKCFGWLEILAKCFE